LLKEVDHRIKNSLQIVASLLYLQAKTAGTAGRLFHEAAARVTAIATVHQQLHKYSDVGTVLLTVTSSIFVRGLQRHRAVRIGHGRFPSTRNRLQFLRM
jgi:two-component sensor histidine kinase